MKIFQILCILGLLWSASEARSLEAIQKSGYVNIGLYDGALLGKYDENGTFWGFNEIFAKRIAQDLDVELRALLVPPEKRLEYVKFDRVDILLANFTQTPQRAEQVDFALPYMRVFLGVISRADAAIENEEQFHYKIVCAVEGSSAHEYLMEHFDSTVKIHTKPGNEEILGELQNGKCDTLIMDNTQALAWAHDHAGYVVKLAKLGAMEVIAPAIRKGNFELLRWLNAEIRALGGENYFHTLYDETLKELFGDALEADDVVIEGGRL